MAGVLDDVDERTTAIVATFLRHAGRGEFAERLHGVLETWSARQAEAEPPAGRATRMG